MSTWSAAFYGLTDLKPYGDNALALFSLALRFGLDDLHTVAADALTDGADDKNCDIVYVDADEGRAVICQCYFSQKSRIAAPSAKASTLNTALGWLLQRPINELPERLRPMATELRTGLKDKSVQDLHVWYVHNLPESENVRQELLTVEHTLQSILKTDYRDLKINSTTKEVGQETLEEWYAETQSPILVTDRFEIKISPGFEVKGANWKAYVTTVPGTFLHRTYKSHGVRLFSANVRDYLGSRKSDNNINNGIKKLPQKLLAISGCSTMDSQSWSIHTKRRPRKMHRHLL